VYLYSTLFVVTHTVTLKALRHGSHSVTCNYTMPINLSTQSLLLSRSLAHDAGMRYSEALFHSLDGAVGASNQL